MFYGAPNSMLLVHFSLHLVFFSLFLVPLLILYFIYIFSVCFNYSSETNTYALKRRFPRHTDGVYDYNENNGIQHFNYKMYVFYILNVLLVNGRMKLDCNIILFMKYITTSVFHTVEPQSFFFVRTWKRILEIQVERWKVTDTIKFISIAKNDSFFWNKFDVMWHAWINYSIVLLEKHT